MQAFTDLADFIAVRQNLLGIKARAEGLRPESPAKMYGELGMWLLSFLCAYSDDAERCFRSDRERRFDFIVSVDSDVMVSTIGAKRRWRMDL